MDDTQRKIIGGNNRANGYLFENLLDKCSADNEELFSTIQLIAEILKGFKGDE